MFDKRSQLVLTTTGYYEIEASETLWHPFQISSKGYVIFSAAHTKFYNNQNWTIRVWASDKISGISITGSPLASQRFISPLKIPQKFGFYDVTNGIYKDNTLMWAYGLAPDTTYYINIENVENRKNGFYLKIDFGEF
jgi:hypothetical protein